MGNSDFLFIQKPKVKRIVCFANSRKLGGHCIAGKEWLADGVPGQWVRLVSESEFGEVSAAQQRYQDGSDPLLLDIMDVPVLRANPKTFQRENWLIDSARRWVKAGRISWEDLSAWVDEDAPLWINGHSSRDGVNDRVPVDEANDLSDSLRLIRVERLLVSVEPPKPDKTHLVLRGEFHYNGADYRLKITDAEVERRSEGLSCGEYAVRKRRYLTISLSEPFEGYCYKLIAAIIKD